jgi:thymidylate kinase
MAFVRQSVADRGGARTVFVGYHEPTGAWIELDVVTELAFGPDASLLTDVATGCLARRRPVGTMFALSDDDAFWILLLDRLLDQRTFASEERTRLQDLAATARTEGELAGIVDRACPTGWNAARILDAVEDAQWQVLEGIAPPLASSWGRKLAAHGRVRARMRRWLGDTASLRVRAGRGISVAVLGPDGAGKSTLAAGVGRSYYFPVKCVYMGLWQRSTDPPSRLNVTGIAWMTRVLKSWRRYAVARFYVALGYLVIFDRYTFDALLPVGRPQGSLRRAANWMLAHACPAPDLVFVLDAPGTLMFDRKGEHHPEYLEAQRQHFLRMAERLPNALAIDATRGEEAIRRDVIGHIWRRVSARAVRVP